MVAPSREPLLYNLHTSPIGGNRKQLCKKTTQNNYLYFFSTPQVDRPMVHRRPMIHGRPMVHGRPTVHGRDWTRIDALGFVLETYSNQVWSYAHSESDIHTFVYS